MNQDEYLQSDLSVKAEIFSKQFQSVYTREDTESFPEKGPRLYQPMQDISINPNGVKKLLKDLKPYKAAGPNGLPTYILRSAEEELSPFLSRIYQFSLDTGNVSSDWREALIVPLFKKRLKHMASKYRPVSLTSVACKVLEHIVHSNIMRLMDQNGILSMKQQGFPQETVNCYPTGCYHPRHCQ